MAITLADFNKIWASTSPLTPYSFSEANYKQGWNFIGSTPPARQMWDFLQKNNDEKMQYLANNYLPLTGGTMTGTITTSAGGMLLGSGTNNQYWISSATPHDKGAEILLNGVDRTVDPGAFQILARDTNGGLKSLKGSADGSLTWGGNTVPTTDSLFAYVNASESKAVTADTFVDIQGTYTMPSGYTKAIGFRKIEVSSPTNLSICSFYVYEDSFRVMLFSRATLTATVNVTIVVAK